MANTLAESMLEQERDEARKHLAYAYTAMRNALTDLAEGDQDGAIETLSQIVGDVLPNAELTGD